MPPPISPPTAGSARCSLTLVAFAVSMLGLVTADDAITLFVFWEATTITSWLLVGFDHERASARAPRCRRWWSPAAAGWRSLPGCC